MTNEQIPPSLRADDCRPVSVKRNDGVAVRTLQAGEWLTRVAEQGHADSQFALGMMYEHGHGAMRDLRAARSWFERTAASGHQSAQRSLARLTERTPGRLRLRQSR